MIDFLVVFGAYLLSVVISMVFLCFTMKYAPIRADGYLGDEDDILALKVIFWASIIPIVNVSFALAVICVIFLPKLFDLIPKLEYENIVKFVLLNVVRMKRREKE